MDCVAQGDCKTYFKSYRSCTSSRKRPPGGRVTLSARCEYGRSVFQTTANTESSNGEYDHHGKSRQTRQRKEKTQAATETGAGSIGRAIIFAYHAAQSDQTAKSVIPASLGDSRWSSACRSRRSGHARRNPTLSPAKPLHWLVVRSASGMPDETRRSSRPSRCTGLSFAARRACPPKPAAQSSQAVASACRSQRGEHARRNPPLTHVDDVVDGVFSTALAPRGCRSAWW